MADDTQKFPSLKRNRVNLALNVRDKISSMMKPPTPKPASYSEVKDVPTPTSVSSKIAPKTDYVKEQTSKGAPIPAGFSISVQKPKKPNEVGIKVSADGKKVRGETVDKGVSLVTPQDPVAMSLKKQTKVDEKFQIGLRYRMPSKLEKVDKKELHKLSQWLKDQINFIDNERSDFMERLAQYRAQWLDFMSAGLSQIFEGAHDVHVPMIFSKIKAMHSRIFQAVLGIDPPFSLKPKSIVTEKQKYEKEQLLSYIIKDFANLGRGWEDVIDKDIWNFVADGTAVTKQGWQRDVRKYQDVKEEFTGFEDGTPQFEEVEEEIEKIIYDGPTLKTVDLEHFYIAGVNVENPEESDLIGDRTFYTRSQLTKLAKLGYFFEDAIQKVLSQEPMNQNQILNRNASQLKFQKEDLGGVSTQQSGHKVYEIFEFCCSWDIDGDGVDEELVVWFDDRSGQICRLTYLERACAGALRPYTIKRFILRPGSAYGIGMAEMLYGINNELDYIHNQRLDYGTIKNLPFGFVRATSGQKPTEMRLAPGTLYPLDNPQEDVFFPNMGGGTAYGFQEEEKVISYSDEVSGLNRLSMGSMQSQGAARTATGAAALVSEVNANLDIHIKRYQRGYKRNLLILDKQLQELLPLGTVIRMLGFDGKEILMQFENRKAIQFESDFELTANSVSSNKAIERDTANMLMQVLQNPLALQGGIVSPQNLYNVYRNLLQKVEIKDIDAYITKPEAVSPSPFTAKDELTMILGGVTPPIYMQDRHQEKLIFFQEFENSEEFSWYLPEQVEIYYKTKKAHMDMMQAIGAQNPMQGNMTNGGMQGIMAAQLGAGAGVPQGIPQQMSDLAPASSPDQPQGQMPR